MNKALIYILAFALTIFSSPLLGQDDDCIKEISTYITNPETAEKYEFFWNYNFCDEEGSPQSFLHPTLGVQEISNPQKEAIKDDFSSIDSIKDFYDDITLAKARKIIESTEFQEMFNKSDSRTDKIRAIMIGVSKSMKWDKEKVFNIENGDTLGAEDGFWTALKDLFNGPDYPTLGTYLSHEAGICGIFAAFANVLAQLAGVNGIAILSGAVADFDGGYGFHSWNVDLQTGKQWSPQEGIIWYERSRYPRGFGVDYIKPVKIKK